ncbi:YdeI/OmpD-associated family protein [Fulvimonas soli]|jgi:hypothetical protein|uniref:Uncharacterized protein YdeI (YjbR/CyaY-like superfamily) n=1 Tax=Fulvimonas soli TaxID=155197 RepID=A0A316I4T4_9GAMM|nr:YdeI/OmpD-associated family protein [Fulvimonas soli]PWK87687.1 uncharacterized protein YdeI (YjbR/CyaY-like superfamily) [Fulvimonas soli]TNY27959.1 hypothetical protein BV497_00855 [Fulvimonas soli]
MNGHDPRVDAYIAQAAPFARPILERPRAAVHAACPDATETIKWRMPFFEYRGRPPCRLAAFKQHCSFGFWQDGGDADEAGTPGRLASLDDLPPQATLVALVRKAAARGEAATKAKRPAAPKPPPAVPQDLAAALARRQHAAARMTWEAFTPGMRREYVEWIGEARTEPTRQKRLATTPEWLAEGKQRNWKYRKQ